MLIVHNKIAFIRSKEVFSHDKISMTQDLLVIISTVKAGNAYFKYDETSLIFKSLTTCVIQVKYKIIIHL